MKRRDFLEHQRLNNHNITEELIFAHERDDFANYFSERKNKVDYIECLFNGPEFQNKHIEVVSIPSVYFKHRRIHLFL